MRFPSSTHTINATSLILKRSNSTLNLEHELVKIARAKYLKQTGEKSIFPKSQAPAESIFPSLQSINPKEDLQTEEFANKRLGVYSIRKTTTGRIPVYSEIRRGMLRETVVRKVEGDVVQLKKDLQQALPQIDEDNFKVLQESKKVIIKGDHVNDVRKVLKEVLH